MLLIYLRSIFSFSFYHQISFIKKRVMVFFGLYLFFLSLLIAYFVGSTYINKNIPRLLKDFPEVTFENGVLTAPNHPVSVPLQNKAITFVFDASKEATPPNVSSDNLLIWVHDNQMLISIGPRTQTQFLPSDFSFVTSQENLTKHQSALLASARLTFLFFSAFFILFSLFLAFCFAFATALFFNLFHQRFVPYTVLVRWAFFLLGPLSVLWYVRIWVPIPLFSLAQLILCIIYIQQIFNLLPEVPSHEN